MFRYRIFGLLGHSLLRFKSDTSDSRLFLFLSTVAFSVRRSDSLSVFTKNALLSIKSESLRSHSGFLIACKTSLARNTLSRVFKWRPLLHNCLFLLKLSLLITCKFEFLSFWFTFSSTLFDWTVQESPFEACNIIKNETLAGAFSSEFYENFKNTYFEEHLWTAASFNLYRRKIMNRKKKKKKKKIFFCFYFPFVNLMRWNKRVLSYICNFFTSLFLLKIISFN